VIKKSYNSLINDLGILIFLIEKAQLLPGVIQFFMSGQECNQGTKTELAMDRQMATD